MNYIVEGNVDFYKEIANMTENDKEEETENRCLITYETLNKNSIKLICGHQFNYLPIYNEVCTQKRVSQFSSMETTKLLINQMKCPYCRIKIDSILPYIEIYDANGNKLVKHVNGVNFPERYCMKNITCEWLYKEGKEEDQNCVKNAYYMTKNNVEHAYCNVHWRKFDLLNKNMKNKIEKKQKKEKELWTDEMNDYSKTKGIFELKKKLRENGQKVSGNKKELVQRLFEHNVNI